MPFPLICFLYCSTFFGGLDDVSCILDYLSDVICQFTQLSWLVQEYLAEILKLRLKSGEKQFKYSMLVLLIQGIGLVQNGLLPDYATNVVFQSFFTTTFL